MKKTLEILGFILTLQGLAGIVHAVTGWFRYGVVVRHLGFLDGYEVYASIVLAVLGVSMLIASDKADAWSGDRSGTESGGRTRT
ncbi:hypothetical protein IPZ58_07350 [Streptomyces roseoverticillatus]|uniref:hypothetical protein n=1 Tax=Streptomyces roseoverticillatus TaxID=66429 RepID=UPI001F421B75|nr:hypothetical protein [Streptomyces roseoverticillatus]MCF3101394.1 hypothetical protein [Streptomyces roseoverticillatus]